MNAIDERGRLAADRLRGAMTDGFDADAGLAAVRREEVVVRSDEPQPPRRTWMLAAAALVVVALGVVGVLTLRDDESPVTDTPAPATTGTVPTAPSPTTPAADTTAVPDEVTETTLVPDTASTTTPASVDRTVLVADVVQVVEPQRTVLATAGFGSGPGDLGVEECQECDPARPWAPVRIPRARGKVVVADTANRRWMLTQPDDPERRRQFAVVRRRPSGPTVSA